MTHVTMIDGQEVDLLAPDPDTLSGRQIARQLARIARFTGATSRFYCVLEHSITGASVARCGPFFGAYAKRISKAFLLHDAHEAIIGDIKTPVCDLPGVRALIQPVKDRLDRAIGERFDVDFSDQMVMTGVAILDQCMLQREWVDLMPTAWSGDDHMSRHQIAICPINPVYRPDFGAMIDSFMRMLNDD